MTASASRYRLGFGTGTGLGKCTPMAIIDLPTQCPHGGFIKPSEIQVVLDFIGERGGTRTHDPMIKSHVLYRLSYALTRRAV
jgi:hypothetical protein